MKLPVMGIDPGQKGGVAVVDGGVPTFASALPIIDKKVDVNMLANLIEMHTPGLVVVELQSIRSNQSGALTIGANYGRILAVLELASIAHQIITPTQWNKKVGIKAGLKGRDKKDASYATAQRMWGGAFDKLGLRRTQDGPVEALLIASVG